MDNGVVSSRNINFRMATAMVLGVILVGGYLLYRYFDTYNSDDKMIAIVRENFIKMDPRFEDIYIREGDDSYTINKKYITLCVKDPVTGRYYDKNVVMYVALHELAHTLSDCDDTSVTRPSMDPDIVLSGGKMVHNISDDILDIKLDEFYDHDRDHCDKFISIFRSLLHKAIAMGIYDPRYKVPDDYCSPTS